jgi:hypothetical protein
MVVLSEGGVLRREVIREDILTGPAEDGGPVRRRCLE